MIWRMFKCWLGLHAPDTVRDDGNRILQRCLYCDRVVHEFERDENNFIRRVN